MKRELQHKGVTFTIETTWQPDRTWKCEALVFLGTESFDVLPRPEGFDTKKEAEIDTTNKAKGLIDYSLRKRGIVEKT